MLIALLLTLACAADPADAALAEGMDLQRRGDSAAALAAYDRCLASAPDHVACWWERGWALYSLRRWPEVVAAWERVQALDPLHPELERWLAGARQQVASAEAVRAALADAPQRTTSPAPPPGTTLRVRAVGDIMLGTTVPEGHLPPDDGAKLLLPVADLLADADLTFGNLEGPLCDDGETRKCGDDARYCYAFRSPTRYGAYLRDAGIDVMSTANNHSGDFGESCRRVTERTLDSLGIAWSGPPGSIATNEAAGLRVATIAFTTSLACNYVNDHDAAAELVRLADATHDLVIVSFHGGAEGASQLHVPDAMELFHGEKRGHLRAFSRAVIAAGADLVLGHGPHVPRGLEVVDGRLVAYSLGNFATYGRFNLSGHLGTSLVLEAELDTLGQLVRGRILPVRQVGRGLPEPDPDATAIGLLRELSEADFPGTALVIAADGSFVPRVAPTPPPAPAAPEPATPPPDRSPADEPPAQEAPSNGAREVPASEIPPADEAAPPRRGKRGRAAP